MTFKEFMRQRVDEIADKAKLKYADGSLYGFAINCEDITHVWALVYMLDRQLEAAQKSMQPPADGWWWL